LLGQLRDYSAKNWLFGRMLGLGCFLRIAVATTFLSPPSLENHSIQTPWFNKIAGSSGDGITANLCVDTTPDDASDLTGCVVLFSSGPNDIFVMVDAYSAIEKYEARGAIAVLISETVPLVPGFV
jgi:hypothetical protein